ncbi:hypothetical protein [Streptomyces sp. C]|nr:hypothetical protein [Streptomyces sp. C]
MATDTPSAADQLLLDHAHRHGGFIHGLWFWLSFRAAATLSDD